MMPVCDHRGERIMRRRLAHARIWFLVLLLAVTGLASVQLAAAPAVQPKRASFEISNAFTVTVPQGAKRVRVWFAAGFLGDVARQNPLAGVSRQLEPVQRELERWSRMTSRDNRYAYCFCDVR